MKHFSLSFVHGLRLCWKPVQDENLSLPAGAVRLRRVSNLLLAQTKRLIERQRTTSPQCKLMQIRTSRCQIAWEEEMKSCLPLESRALPWHPVSTTYIGLFKMHPPPPWKHINFAIYIYFKTVFKQVLPALQRAKALWSWLGVAGCKN